jgi:hypothetical protein
MATKKVKKIKFADGALDKFPEEERESIAEEIKKKFLEGNLEEIGQPLEELPPGKTNCPKCGGALLQGPVLKMPTNDGIVVEQVFDCEKCDRAFIGQPIS